MSSESAGDETYTHTPDTAESVDGEGEPGGPSGWLLVGVVTLATLVIPGLIYLYPTVLADHVPFMVAMLALPFIPALLLGGMGVWAMKE